MRHKCILNHFNQLFFTNCKGRWFLTIKKVKSSKNCFCYTSSFLKGFFATKKIDIELKEHLVFFWKVVFHLPSKDNLFIFQKNLKY